MTMIMTGNKTRVTGLAEGLDNYLMPFLPPYQIYYRFAKNFVWFPPDHRFFYPWQFGSVDIEKPYCALTPRRVDRYTRSKPNFTATNPIASIRRTLRGYQ